MKARNKKTGEVVTNFSISKEWGAASYIDSANTLRFSTPLDGEWEMIGEDESEPVDWSAFRREAAKDILAGMLSNPGSINVENKRLQTIEGFVNGAVMIADELIRQLQ